MELRGLCLRKVSRHPIHRLAGQEPWSCQMFHDGTLLEVAHTRSGGTVWLHSRMTSAESCAANAEKGETQTNGELTSFPNTTELRTRWKPFQAPPVHLVPEAL